MSEVQLGFKPFRKQVKTILRNQWKKTLVDQEV